MKVYKNFDYYLVLKYFFAFIGFLLLNYVYINAPLSCGLYIALIYNGFSLIFTPIIFLFAMFIASGFTNLISMALFSIASVIIFGIYKGKNAKIRFELFVYIILFLVPFLLLDNTFLLFHKIIIVISIIALSIMLIVCKHLIDYKNITFKFDFSELVSIFTIITLFGIGLNNLVMPEIFKIIAIYFILVATFVYDVGVSNIIAVVLSLPLFIYYNNGVYFALFSVISLTATAFIKENKIYPCISAVLTDLLFVVAFNLHTTYIHYALTLIAPFLFFITPNKFLQKLKNNLYLFKEKQLSRQTINRSRTMLSNKLYELSGVFLEIGNIFQSLRPNLPNEDNTKNFILNNTYKNYCSNCENNSNCPLTTTTHKTAVKKVIDIGFAKGKISYVDLPKYLAETCKNASGLILFINKLIQEYKSKMLDIINLQNGRELIGSQSIGVAEVLKGLALESSQTLKYQTDLENLLIEGLSKRGYNPFECLIYGEKENVIVSLLLNENNLLITDITNVIYESLNMKMVITEKVNVGTEKCYLILKKAPLYNAVFGLATKTKEDSLKSGDTHSVIKIGEEKFLVALSDGMGSGEVAEKISNASLSLIESFYKTGMSSNLILKTVNKILAINSDDTFTALDICVINLNSLKADFIKYGAPYGFIVNDYGIKMIEGNSLPMGILNDLEPTITTSKIDDGDMLIFFTDGISDAFTSSSEVIDFLRSSPCKNPQTLANDILNKAIEYNKGEIKDDMTVLTLRIYKY